MNRPPKGPTRPRTQRTARRLDRKKALELRAKGLSTEEIAKHQGVARTTVWRFLQQTEPEQRALEHFKSHRADALAHLQGKAIDVQHLLLDQMKADLTNKAISSALTPTAKTAYLNAAATVSGISFDKERLERGQSTANISTVSKMIDRVVTSMHKPKPANGPQAQLPKGVPAAVPMASHHPPDQTRLTRSEASVVAKRKPSVKPDN